MDTVVRYDWQNMTTAQILDECVELINLGKNELTPFYWTDSLPTGETYEQTVYTVSPITDDTFDTLYSYDFDSANYRAILIYLNDTLLLGGDIDYTVATDGPRVTILVPLTIGDTITIREYTTTYGNFVPSTPTKLGLYASFMPEIYLDDAYVDPTLVIRGHDGSITVAYTDIRDQVLLEFEKRIFNNLKCPTHGPNDNPRPLTYTDVVPGWVPTNWPTENKITFLTINSLGTTARAKTSSIANCCWVVGVASTNISMTLMHPIPDHGRCWDFQKNPHGGN